MATRNRVRADSAYQDSERIQVTGPTGFSPAKPWNSAVRKAKAPTMRTRGEKNWAAESFGCIIHAVIVFTESTIIPFA